MDIKPSLVLQQRCHGLLQGSLHRRGAIRDAQPLDLHHVGALRRDRRAADQLVKPLRGRRHGTQRLVLQQCRQRLLHGGLHRGSAAGDPQPLDGVTMGTQPVAGFR